MTNDTTGTPETTGPAQVQLSTGRTLTVQRVKDDEDMEDMIVIRSSGAGEHSEYAGAFPQELAGAFAHALAHRKHAHLNVGHPDRRAGVRLHLDDLTLYVDDLADQRELTITLTNADRLKLSAAITRVADVNSGP